MGKFVLLAVCAMLPGWLLGVEEWLKHINEEKGYSIEYPANWIKDVVPEEDFDLFAVEPNNRASLSIITQKISSDVTLDQFYTLNLKSLLNDTEHMEIKDNCSDQLAGVNAFWILYTRTDKEGVEILQYLLIANGEAFVITMGTAEDQYQTFEKTFNKIVDSFDLTNSD